MIRRFTIEGFKRFERETVVDLDDVTVLVGANNSGKSTILLALTLFQYCVETTRRTNGNGPEPGRLALVRRTVSPDEFGVLPVAAPADLWPHGRVRIKGRANPLSLRAEFDNDATIGFQLRMDYNRFDVTPIAAGRWREAIDGRDIRLVPIFSGFLPREEYLTLLARRDRMRLQRHGEMVRNLLLWALREHAGPRWNTLQALLEELFPESAIQVRFDLEVDRFLNATYRDRALTRDRDVIAAGSGFHQALQILASVLAPRTGMVLLDEPDAHLHGRLQDQLLRILARLAHEEPMQFVLATHSPQLLDAAPEGSVRVCLDGRVAPLLVEPEQLRLLEELGALERMEIVPLLAHRAVVFVESKRDRNLLQDFARKHWGEKKQQEVWRALTFLYTYQSPVDAGVLDLGRQVRDLLNSAGSGTGRPVRMLAIGDRDYRTDASRRAVLRTHAARAKTDAYRLDLKLLLWEANEIENHLLDRTAMLTALDRQAAERGAAAAWKRQRRAFAAELDRLLDGQREHVRQRVATRIQQGPETRAEHGARQGRRVPGRAVEAARTVVRRQGRPRRPPRVASVARTGSAADGTGCHSGHARRPRRRQEGPPRPANAQPRRRRTTDARRRREPLTWSRPEAGPPRPPSADAAGPQRYRPATMSTLKGVVPASSPQRCCGAAQELSVQNSAVPGTRLGIPSPPIAGERLATGR